MSVTVVSCIYGLRGFEKFRAAWNLSVDALERPAQSRIIAGDHASYAPSFAGRSSCPWRYPQAYYLQQAIEQADTDWVWILDIDDIALPDALNGIDDVTADVWTMGFEVPDGETYIPPPMTADDVLSAPTSLIPGTSAIRTEAFRRCGGFLDVAFQDWALWRSLARDGATFETSGRVHTRYNQHPGSRCATELTADRRAEHMAEMLAAEEASVAVA